MKSNKAIKFVCLLLVLVLGGIPVVYASESAASVTIETSSQYSNEQLIDFVDQGFAIESDVVTATKLSDIDKETIIQDAINIDLDNSDVYEIHKQISDTTEEVSVVVAASPVPENQGIGSSGRVYATAVIGYQEITQDQNPYRRGIYYGGYISDQPNSSVITSLKSTYREGGQYILFGSSGTYIETPAWSTSFNHDLSKHSTRQTRNINTQKYFLMYTAGETGIGVILNVAGTVNGYPFSFSATVSGM